MFTRENERYGEQKSFLYHFIALFLPNQEYENWKKKAEKIFHTHKKFTTNWVFLFLSHFPLNWLC